MLPFILGNGTIVPKRSINASYQFSPYSFTMGIYLLNFFSFAKINSRENFRQKSLVSNNVIHVVKLWSFFTD